MAYKADRIFGSWLDYFERIGWEATKEACIVAARKYPHEINGILWAINMMSLGRIVSAMAPTSPEPRND